MQLSSISIDATKLLMSTIAEIFTEFRNRLEVIEKQLQGVIFSPMLIDEPWFRESMNSLKQLVRDPQFEPIAEEVIASPFFKHKAIQLRSIYELYEVFLETFTCLDYLQTSTAQVPTTNNPEMLAATPAEILHTSESAIAEGRAAELGPNSHVLFVGSGPFPETALSLHHEFGCRVTCIDYNPEAVVLSSRLLKAMQLEDKIQVFFRDACDFSFEGYTHIWLAALARPKRQILERVCSTADQQLTVVCRTVNGLRQFLYESANDVVLEHFDIIDKVIDLERTSHYALVLRKRAIHTHER